jgi:nucleotide-binding universal stress UspA family protein
MKCILATDGSEASEKAARWVREHFPLTSDSRVFLIYVFPLPPDLETYSHLVELPQDPADERVRDIAAPVIAKAREALGTVDAEVFDVTLIGNPAEEIVSFATAQHADLIVSGHHGQGLRKEVVLGCVSNAIAHTARCPVLIVR